MDYDDNDFQSQNFHLAGEENSKFPPGLRSYALPKFDLDDSLQVHLTFDSLVETEVLLGIQSQEENRWIEFSRGSSDIDFSSSAPESCSISRPNNVWSEATSSESVEMLLNSVGQDEMITEQTIIEESDVFDELGNLTNQMEPSLKQHGSILSIIGDVVDSGPTLSSEKCLERFSGLNEDAGVELPHVGATSQTHEGEKYGNEISRDRDLDPSSVSEKCGLPMTEGSLLIDGKCTDANKREGGPSVDRSLDNRTGNNSTTSVQVDHSASVQGIIASVGDLNNQGAPQLVTDLAYENTDGLRNDDDENGVEHQVLNKETQMDVRNCEGNAIETNIKNVENPFIMKMDSNVQILEGNVVETSINIVEDPFSLALTTDPTVVDIAEGCSKDACFVNTVPISECEVMVLSKDIEMGDLLIGNTHETSLVVEGNNGFEGHAGEISNSNAGMGSGLEMKMDSVAQITHGQNNFVSLEKQEDILETDFHQLERGASVSNSEMSLLTVEDNKLFGGQCDRSSNSHVRDLSGLTVEVCSSGNLFREAQAIENIKDGNDGLGVHVEIFNGKDHISSCVQVESTQACNRNVVGQSDIHASQPNVSVVEKGNAWLPTDSGDIDCDIDGRLIIEKRAASSSLGHSAAEIEVVAHETSYFEKLEGILETDFHQLERGVSVSNPEKSLLTMEDKKLFGGQCDGSSNSHVEDLSGLTVEVCSSGSLLRERQAIENVKDGHNGLGIQVEIFNAKDHISSCVQAESTQACKRNVVGQSDIHDSQPDVSVVEKGNACLPTDSGNMDCDIDGCLIIEKRAASSSLGHSAAEIEVVAHESSSYQIFRDVLEDTNLASCDTLDGVHNLLSAKDGATDEGTEHKQGGKSPLLVGDFTLPDEKEETVTKISTEPSSLDLKDYSHMESESVPVSEDQGTICDNARQLLCETVGQSSSPMETDNITCQDEPRAAVENKATQEHSIDLEMCSVRHDSKMKGNDAEVVELVALGNHEVTSLSVAGDCTDKKRFAGTMPSEGETPIQSVPSSMEELSCDVGQKDQEDNESSLVSRDNNSIQIVFTGTGDALNGCDGTSRPSSLSEHNAVFHPLEAGGRTSNSDELNCGSPTVISCSEISQSGEENPEGGKASLDQSALVSDAIDGVGNTVGSISQDPKRNDASEDDRSFTFEVSSLVDLSEIETSKGWKPFPSKPYEFPQTVEGSASTTSSLCQMDLKMLKKIPHGSPQSSEGKNVCGSSRGTSEHKTRRVSGKATDKETAKEGKLLKEITPVRQKAGRANSCNLSPSSLGTISQVAQAKEMQSYGYIGGSSTKPCGVPTVQTSNLPDLNTSASPSAPFQQPFTDLQQVQLRAQIYVYGSLIQGTAPDEACMISAFGESDGERGVWDNVWCLSVERLYNQKSPLSNPETPVHSHSGSLTPVQASRQSALQSIVLSAPVGRGSSCTPSAIINPMIPLSSPLWNISTPSRDGLQPGGVARSPLLDSHQMISPLHPYQSPHIRNHLGHTTPWLSQPPCPRPWVLSPRSYAPDASAHYSALPIAETVHVTSVRESSVPCPSPPNPFVYNGDPISVFTGTAPLLDAKNSTISPGKHASSDSKFRKRKKSPASEELGQICLLAQSQREPVLAPDVTSHISTSVAITTPVNFASKMTPGNFIAAISPTSTTHYQVIGGRDMEQRLIFSDEMCSNVEHAKLQAEDAAALAAAAFRHSQSVWSQLADLKNTGLVSDVEAKLASAAVAVAAAASVANAAAAAAKVAFDAALQAKLMADEAVVSSRIGNSTQNTETSISDPVNNLGTVTPASILKGKDKTNSSSSIVVAAREAARMRVEAASAATKRAENLDAVVKAAEMAAEAIAQAGAIIAMGDPLPLTMSELVEAGPEGYWKVQEVSSDRLVISNNIHKGEQTNIDNVGEGLDTDVKHFNKQPSNKKETKTTYQGGQPSSKEMSRESMEEHIGLIKGMHWDSITNTEKGLGGEKSCKASDPAKTIGVVPESEIGSRFASIAVQNEDYEGHHPAGTPKENSIREGSLVEVLFDEDGLRRVWFSAKVLSLKDGKAYVCYTELPPDEGSRKLNEWVALNGEGDNTPRVRFARPMTTMKFEGTRKRQRDAMADYAWSVGDRVDAWIRDGWWEGIITEKSKDDETTLTVHFPDKGDTSIVRAWHLRPSLICKDGQWMEWSRPRENNCYPHEGDTPQEKRLKVGNHGSEIVPVTGGMDKMSKNMGIDELGKPEELRSLALSAKEKIFNVGKNIREENKSNALRTKQPGLQKEGSRVIYGVPKPGKKRKFMDVSKHYDADRSGKIKEGKDSLRFAKYLIPQGSGFHGWKSSSKVVSKENRVAEFKPKVLKSGKPPSVPSRNLPQKDNSLSSAVSNEGTVRDHLPNVKASVSHDENVSEKQNLIEVGHSPDTHKAAEGQVLFSSLARPSDATSSNKKSSSAIKADRVNRVKLLPSGDKLARIKEKDTGHNDNPGKSLPGVVEPRRSNRRIQPTSRLLEGLQSSLIISKIPVVAHVKGTNAQHRSASSSRVLSSITACSFGKMMGWTQHTEQTICFGGAGIHSFLHTREK